MGKTSSSIINVNFDDIEDVDSSEIIEALIASGQLKDVLKEADKQKTIIKTEDRDNRKQ